MIAGAFNFSQLPNIFEGIRTKKITGILKLSHGGAVKSIFFKEGNVVYASSSENIDRLGDILLKTHKITADQYKTSADLIKKTGKRQGSILVEMGVITPKELFEALKVQIREIISSIFLWDSDGKFELAEGELPNNIIPLPIELADILNYTIEKLENLEV